MRNIRISIKIRYRKINNALFGNFRRKKLLNKDFTIISNNCWGGHVYRYFKMPYLSPTIGLYFNADDYLKFCKNLKKYINETKLEFIDIANSHNRELLLLRKENCPIGKLDDIEVIFLHYKTRQEAEEKWNRRCSRVNWDNIYIKNSEQNGCNEKILKEFDKIKCKNKIVFTTLDYHLKSQILYDSGCLGKREIPIDTYDFYKYVNLVKFLNLQYCAKKQKKLFKKLNR